MAVLTAAQISRLTGEFATAEQGALAVSAAQTGDPVSQFVNDTQYLVPGANVSLLTNNANFVAAGANLSVFTNDVGFVSGEVTTQQATVTGTTLTLTATPLAWFQPLVFVNGAMQPSAAYTIVGTTVTFTAPLAAAIVQVVYARSA